MCQEPPFLGYEPGYHVGYEQSYANGYSSPLVMVEGGSPSGYSNYTVRGGRMDDVQGFQQSSDFHLQAERHNGMMHQQHMHADLPSSQPQVLQLSAAIYQQLPPPPAPPAPMDVSRPPMPAPPSSSPGDDDDYDCDDGEDDYNVNGVLVTDPPTRGSMNHGVGRCKPCAFVHTKGCGNGFECPFCHLCAPGEKKKRRKEKLEARRTMREMRQAFSLDFLRMRRGSGQVQEL
jgi:hypothetical protein